MPWFCFSALSYSKCSHAVRKQRSEELGQANMSPAAVWQRSQIGCEIDEISQPTSSPGTLHDLDCSTTTVNSTVGSRRSKEHSQICSLDDHSNLLKPSEGSVALSADSSFQMYVFYLRFLKSVIMMLSTCWLMFFWHCLLVKVAREHELVAFAVCMMIVLGKHI